MKRLALALAGLALAPSLAAAQCNVANTGACTQSRAITLTIVRTAEMTLSATATTLSSPTAAIYAAGSAVDAGPSITVKANGAWRLNVSAGTTTWSATGPLANPAKPTSDLGLGTSAGGPFTPLGVSGFQLASGNAATAGTVVATYYQTQWHWTTDPPGSYSLTLTVTLTSP